MSFKDGWTRTGFFKVKLIYCNRSFVFAETEVSKTVDMYLFLFDDILLLTKVKKQPRKVRIWWCIRFIEAELTNRSIVTSGRLW